jgi:tetratricopeptide (TPR) repeat protein
MSRESVWIHRPLFISSTFNDFQAERDHLRRVVFPGLEERLRHEGLRVHLETIDLRWGVDTLNVDFARQTTATVNPDKAKQLMVLKVCLDEIERSRPFIVALLGDRYGWTPPHDRMKWAVDEKGLSISEDDLIHMSVTALEIEYGILHSPEQQKRCRIYLRCLDYRQMPANEQKNYLDPEDSDAARHLTALKGRLLDQFPDRVCSYSVQWDRDRKQICQSDIHAWGKVVMAELWQDIQSEFGNVAGWQKRTWQQDEQQILEEFVEDRSHDFVERCDRQNQNIVDALVSQALATFDDDRWGLCLTGEAGAGKSSLFASVYRRLQDKEVVLLAHAAGVGGQSTRVDRVLLRWIDELSAISGESNPFEKEVHPSAEQLQATFDSLLTRVSATRRVVVLLDALDQFERTPRVRQMTWIPQIWPRNARLIATTMAGSESTALADRQGVEIQELDALSSDESRQIVIDICRHRYHRQVRTEIVNEIVSRTIPGSGQSAAGNPLWLKLAVEEINLVDADDFARARANRRLNPDQQLHQMLLDVARSLPPTVEEIYSMMLQRAEEVSGESWARAFVSLISLSRTGLRESDLKVLLPLLTSEEWNDYQFAVLRRSFRAHLVYRGQPARYDFFHRQMRIAVQRRYLNHHTEGQSSNRLKRLWRQFFPTGDSSADDVAQIHRRMADHLESLSAEDPLARTELMWHLASAGDRSRSAHHYNSVSSAHRVDEVTATLLAWLLDVEGESRVVRAQWIASLPDVPELHPDESTDLAQRLVTDFDRMLEATGDLKLRLAILCRLREILLAASAASFQKSDVGAEMDASKRRSMLARNSEVIGRPNQMYSLTLLNIRLGEVHSALEDIPSAREAYRRAEKALELMARLPMVFDRGETLKQLSRLQSRTAEILLRTNQLKQAHGVIQKQAEAAEQNSIKEQQMRAMFHLGESDVLISPESQRDRALALENLGDLARKEGRLHEAEKLYSEAFQIRRKLIEEIPGNKSLEWDWLIILAKLGDLNFEQKSFDRADEYYRKCLPIARSLADRFPEDLPVKRNLAAAHLGCAKIHIQKKQLHDAEEHLLQTLKLRQQLTEQMPDNSDVRRELTDCYVLIAVIELAGMAAGRPASPQGQQCLEYLHGISGAGQPLAPEVLQIRDQLQLMWRDQVISAVPSNEPQDCADDSQLLIQLHDQAMRLVQAGRNQEAVESLKHLEQLAARLGEKREVVLALEQQAIALQTLERFDEAESVVQRLISKCRLWDDRPSLIFALGCHSQLLKRRQQLEPALDALKEAESICRGASQVVSLKSVLFHKSDVLKALGRTMESEAAMSELRMLERIPF